MKDGESISQLYGRFKELLNGFHSIGDSVENRDLFRYALKAFPKSTLQLSIVNGYKVSRDLSTIKLDKLFYEFELHEQSNTRLQENGIALITYSKPKGTSKSKKKEKKKK